jgi:membrane protease YdiL (CAAX protease family)
MNCNQCGARVAEGSAFCGACGAPVSVPATTASAGDAVARGPFSGGRIDWTLRDVLLGIGLFLLLFLIAPIPFVLPFLAFGEHSSPYLASALIVTAAADVGLVAVAARFTFRKYGGSWSRLGFRRPTWSTLGYAVAAVVAAFLLAYIYGLIVEVFDIDWLRSHRDDQLPNEVLDRGVLLAIAGVVIVAFAPVCEETFFRGFLLTGFAKRWGVPVAIVVSSMAFAAAHVGPHMERIIVPILIIGVVLGYTYYRSRNLLANIGAHLMFNALSFTGLALSDPDKTDQAAALLVSLVHKVAHT